MIGRKTGIAIALVMVVVLGLFLVTGSLDPPARLKTRPHTATPITPTATATIRR